MATRKIKDAYDIDSGERIYYKGHALATFLSDGKNVEDAINSIQTGAYKKVTIDLTDAVLQPNAVTEWAAPISSELALSFAEQQDQGYAAEYIARFSVGADGVQLIVPDSVVWADGVLPAMANGKTYEISFVDNLATFLEF